MPPMVSKVKVLQEKLIVRIFLAEFISTYVMMMFGLGSVAHMTLAPVTHGTFLGVNLGFGFGVTMGVHLAGSISGAHMNAAITFTTCAMGRMSWKRFPVYVLGQCLGSFLAAATVFCLFYVHIKEHAGGQLLVTGPLATAGIFATYLPKNMTLWRGFLDEVVVTAMLQLCLLAITDKRNSPAAQGTEPEVIGILVVVIGVSLGMNSGYAMNPSRDLPPRFFTFLAGWGAEVFRAQNWWWVPVVAPLLGAYLGALIYIIFISSCVPREPKTGTSKVSGDRTSVLPKTTAQSAMTSSRTPVSVYPENRPIALASTSISDPIHLEPF
ncbi:aquaporin-7 isoform X2 [Talpa occidentalis]|nr:aquaporin-7 isoform X2 [Talpa occidentalis]XP_054544873.1 aquaporin-7 isoform X2 [Talpa occidentalis]XP_054544874.1 aquaporin-7 isoform X2 [Talpa occidentalis]XP_054544875.1 aquaporin-7 isoform X2 [Talpa occidentalis]